MTPNGQPILQPLDVNDFSGGITDFYMGAPTNRAKTLDNLDVIKYGDKGKLRTRFGSALYDSSNPQIPSGNVRVGALKVFQGKVLPFSANNVYLNNSGWATVTGPSGNQVFPSGTTQANVISMTQDDYHLLLACDSYPNPQKVFVDSGTVKLRTAGLPRLASSPTITPGANTGKSFLYRFIYTYQYTASGVTFKTVGGFVQVSVSNADAPNTNANAISAIPILVNGASDNYDTSNIKVEIYRTINNGSSQFYLVGSVTNGTTTFSDNVSDTALQLNQAFYMNGGAVENQPLLPCTCVHIVPNGITYFGNVQSGGQTIANRVMQGIPGAIDAVNSNFFVDLPDNVVGISSVRGLPLALCSGSVYRLDGTFDLLGRGGIQATRISDTAGCVSAQSVVQTVEGVFWAGPFGFYFSDGYQVIRINENWPNSYQTYVQTQTQKNRIQGKYDQKNRRILWTAQSSTAGAADCDIIFVLHLDFGISKESVFSTYSGSSYFGPSSIEFNGSNMLRGHKLGYILQHTTGTYTDPRIDTNVTPTSWDINPIIYDYKSVAHDFGMALVRKAVPSIVFESENLTNSSIQINSINDDGVLVQSCKPIRYRGNAQWGDSSAIWGTPTDVWNVDGTIIVQRHFPRNSLRCSYKQIEITNAHVAIQSSDALGNITVDASAKTATLNTVGAQWPLNILNYYISFAVDNYTKEYLISTLNASNQITFVDAQNTCPSGTNLTWVLRGIPKGEALGLLRYTLRYVLFGQTQKPYSYVESGEVGSASR